MLLNTTQRENSNDKKTVKQLKKQRAVSRKKSQRTRTISTYLRKAKKNTCKTERIEREKKLENSGRLGISKGVLTNGMNNRLLLKH